MTWFYMSFADASLPEGQQFLGGCYVEADTLAAAITWTHVEGINPGGEIQCVEVPAEGLEANVPPGNRFRLLAREEIETPALSEEDTP
jgi:hypothetical protein